MGGGPHELTRQEVFLALLILYYVDHFVRLQLDTNSRLMPNQTKILPKMTLMEENAIKKLVVQRPPPPTHLIVPLSLYLHISLQDEKENY